jgi:transcriptional regulator with XRE-family HTH domain
MMSGLSLSAIQGYEQGRYEPKRKSLESIAEVFKIPVDELYDMPAQLSTNLASLGTDCISRQQAIDALRGYLVGKRCPDDGTLTCRLIENEVINKLPPIQPVIVPCDYAKACNEATMDKVTSAVAYYDALEELRKHGYVLVDMRKVTT